MKQLWATDPEKIEKELSQIINNKIPLSCFKAGSKEIRKVWASGLSKKKGTDLLVLYHAREPSCSKKTCMFFYHLPGSSIKCFEASRLKKAGDYLGLEFPTKIYKIQRRRYGRVSTPNYSTATFTVDNKQRINYGTVENISHNGAYISCDLPSIIDEGDLINSLSMSVCLRLSREEKTILRVTEALVVRSVVFDSRTKGLGIHFDLLGEMKDLMEEYLNLRHIEDGSFQDVGHLE